MIITSTHPQPGVYQYSYPTFVDKPQLISVHFITPDEQYAFVTYPDQRSKKRAQLIPLSWFDSVNMVKLAQESQLMHFLKVIVPALLHRDGPTIVLVNSSKTEIETYTIEALQAA